MPTNSSRLRPDSFADPKHPETPWITVAEAAKRARCGIKLIYREVRGGRLKAVRIGGRRELRLRSEWIDAWLLDRTAERRDR